MHETGVMASPWGSCLRSRVITSTDPLDRGLVAVGLALQHRQAVVDGSPGAGAAVGLQRGDPRLQPHQIGNDPDARRADRDRLRDQEIDQR